MNVCVCGHEHLTTRGPCVRFDTCDCRVYLVDPDPAHLIARRRRDLMAAVNACEHSKDEIRRTMPRRYPERRLPRRTDLERTA